MNQSPLSLKLQKLHDKVGTIDRPVVIEAIAKVNHYEYLLEVLVQARFYVKAAHDHAERLHDSDGEYKDDGGQWEIMEETQRLLDEIDNARGVVR